jgi:hypothetical protein
MFLRPSIYTPFFLSAPEPALTGGGTGGQGRGTPWVPNARAHLPRRAAASGLLGALHGSCSRGGTVLIPADDPGGRVGKSA